MLMSDSKEDANDPDHEEETKRRIRREREEELCDTFRMFDIDQSGFISADEPASTLSPTAKRCGAMIYDCSPSS